MTESRPATDLFVGIHTRIAAHEGVPMIVLHRGYAKRGTIILKINFLNGFARILTESRMEDECVWTPATLTDPMPEKEADAYLAQQADIDPDVWLIEIEDKQGRIWFPGKVVKI